MRATWVSSRRADSARASRGKASGFTLIELLVVLTLMGLMMGLVLPLGLRALENSHRRGAVADLRALLAGYPLEASHAARPLVIDAARIRSALSSAPQDCLVSLAEPLRYEASGMARGGRVVLTCQGEAPWVFQVALLTGEVRLQAH